MKMRMCLIVGIIILLIVIIVPAGKPSMNSYGFALETNIFPLVVATHH